MMKPVHPIDEEQMLHLLFPSQLYLYPANTVDNLQFYAAWSDPILFGCNQSCWLAICNNGHCWVTFRASVVIAYTSILPALLVNTLIQSCWCLDNQIRSVYYYWLLCMSPSCTICMLPLLVNLFKQFVCCCCEVLPLMFVIYPLVETTRLSD